MHVLEFEQASVAFHVRVMICSAGHPSFKMTSVYVIPKVEQLSVAVDVPVFAGNVLAVHSTVIFPGHDIAGGVVSCMVMI